MKKICIVVLACFVTSYLYGYDWENIADSIAVVQLRKAPSWCSESIKVFRDNRKKDCRIDYFNRKLAEGDTIIFMEDHICMRSTKETTFWIKGKPESFTTYGFSHFFSHDLERCSYPPSLRKLCNFWDTISIKREEKKHPVIYLSSSEKYILATRLILKQNNEFEIECVFFREFWMSDDDLIPVTMLHYNVLTGGLS